MRKITWALTGVWVRGLTWLTARGSAPSIDIATATRVQPTMTLKTTWSALSRIPMIIKNRMIGLSVRTIARLDRKSTRLNSSHGYISYAVFCLKKKNGHVFHDEYVGISRTVSSLVMGANNLWDA